MKYINHRPGLSKTETYPSSDIGTIFHLMETQIRRANPVTKVGRDVPKSTKTDPVVSGQRFLNFAAITPSDIPTTSHSTNAPTAKFNVTGRDSLIISVTHAFSLNEYPKAGAGQLKAAWPLPYVRPTKIPDKKSQYCS
jgi:hypothetical protein